MLALLYGMNSAGHPAADIAHAPFLKTLRTNPDYVGEWTQQALQVEAVGALGDALRCFRDLCAKVQPIIKAAAIEKPATKAVA